MDEATKKLLQGICNNLDVQVAQPDKLGKERFVGLEMDEQALFGEAVEVWLQHWFVAYCKEQGKQRNSIYSGIIVKFTERAVCLILPHGEKLWFPKKAVVVFRGYKETAKVRDKIYNYLSAEGATRELGILSNIDMDRRRQDSPQEITEPDEVEYDPSVEEEKSTSEPLPLAPSWLPHPSDAYRHTTPNKVGETIFSQIKRNTFECLGASHITIHEEMGCLDFKARIRHGQNTRMLIFHNTSDYYTIQLIRIRAGKVTLLNELHDIDCETLDKMVFELGTLLGRK